MIDSRSLRSNGSQLNFMVLYKTDSQQPGDLFYTKEFERNVQVKRSPIYTDYDNIVVFYECWERKIDSIVIKDYQVFMLTKTREFDSFTQFEAAIKAVHRLGIDFNRLRFLHNKNDCGN